MMNLKIEVVGSVARATHAAFTVRVVGEISDIKYHRETPTNDDKHEAKKVTRALMLLTKGEI